MDQVDTGYMSFNMLYSLHYVNALSVVKCCLLFIDGIENSC